MISKFTSRWLALLVLVGVVLSIPWGCRKPAQPSPPAPAAVTQFDVFDAYSEVVGVGSSSVRIDLRRKEYFITEESWITGWFSSLLWEFYRAKGYGVMDSNGTVSQYSLDTNNCFDFAEDARYYMRELERGAKVPGHIAWGRAIYYTDAGTRHAVNTFLILDSKKDLKVKFFEPQTQRIVVLSEKELRDCEIEL